MISTLLIVFTLCATVLHVFIFYIEVFAWTSPFAQKTFGVTKEFAQQTKEMAANQGVYNVLFAAISLAGLIMYTLGNIESGLALITAGCGSMSAAALYLFFSSNKKTAALKQLVFPLLALVCVVLLVQPLI